MKTIEVAIHSTMTDKALLVSPLSDAGHSTKKVWVPRSKVTVTAFEKTRRPAVRPGDCLDTWMISVPEWLAEQKGL